MVCVDCCSPRRDSSVILMCVDLSHLNGYVRRERYHSLTSTLAVVNVAADKAKILTKLDAMKGYNQCPMDLESQLLTTL